MASILLPSTPKVQTQEVVETPSPGNWRHPRLKEIVQRQNAGAFGENHVRKILLNFACLFITGFLANFFGQISIGLGSLFNVPAYPGLILFTIRALLVINIGTALYPLCRAKDNLSDIPLTPSQRTLLGLDPSESTPVTPGSTYITPPKYRISSGSRKGSPISPSSSPLSGRGSPSGLKGFDGSWTSTSSSSPLFQKAINNGNRERRPSLGSVGSPPAFGRSILSGSLRTPSTPSPAGKLFGPSLTNKWLYDKARPASPTGGSVFR